MNVEKIKLVAMDLDGTLSQHKQPLPPENLATLKALAKKYRLVMVGAGQIIRVFNQLEQFPIDIIGSYGMQYGKYNYDTKQLDILRNDILPCNRESIEERVTMLREKYGFTKFSGENVEFHASGCVTFPCLGTKARQEDKLAFDPDRKKRRAIYDEVCRVFSDYTVFIGGTSSFDMVPAPYNKYYALDLYCKELGLSHENAVFIGDDYGPGGNDESVYLSDFPYLTIDDYHTFPQVVAPLL